MGWRIFGIPFPPIPWRRACRNGNRSYTDPVVEQAKVNTQWAAKAAHVPFSADQRPMFLMLRVFIQPPKQKKALPPLPTLQRSGIGDVDNYSKLVMDAFNDQVWHDDAQVVGLVVLKDWAVDGIEPHTEVAFSPVAPEVWRGIMRESTGTCLSRIAEGKLGG